MSAGIDSVLQAAVDAGDVPCVVAMAADASGPIYEGAAGPRAVGASDPVTPGHDVPDRVDDEDGRDDRRPAAGRARQPRPRRAGRQYLPEFADLQVLEGFDGDTPRLRPPATRATVRHLVTHTSGLAYWFFNADIVRFEELTGTPNALSGSNAIFAAPLVADPGAQYEYGINTDWLGRVVEAASGQSLDDYFAEHILGPLGMTSTTFLMSEEQRANSVPVHLRGEDGAWAPSDVDWSQEPEWWAGGHGLHSTPRDYLKFQRMLLAGGTLDGARILDARPSRRLHQPDRRARLPARDRDRGPGATADFNAGPGHKWGLGLLLNTERQPGMRAAGSGAWAGLMNTHFWVDPASGVTGAIYTQTLPFVEPRVFQVYVDFERALYASLEQGSVRSRRFERVPEEAREKTT